MRRFLIEERSGGFVVLDREILTKRGTFYTVRWFPLESTALSTAQYFNETRGHASQEPHCVHCGGQPTVGNPPHCTFCS